jgi:hypothetical protein
LRHLVRFGAVVFALALVGAACGDDDDDTTSGDTEAPASSDDTGSDDTGSDDTGSDDTGSDDDDTDDTSSDDSGDDDSGDDDSGGGFDRDDAVDDLVDDGIERDPAECYIDGIIDEFGQDRIDEFEGSDVEPTDEEFQALLDLATDCGIDLSEFGGTGDDATDDTVDTDDSGDTDDSTASAFLPGDTYGDNPTLDALWDDCEDGDDDACTDLYLQSEIGSEYEEFGATCGGRDEDFACAS